MGAEVVAAATTRDQAGFVFAPVKSLAEKAPALKGHVKAYASKIVHPASGSYFEVISSVADAQHGANLHGAVIDELHVHKTPEMVETIETGTGSRDQPLIACITTADDGRPGTIYARKRRRIEELANRVITDPTTYGVVWAAPADADPFAEATWKASNPGYGISPTRSYLEKEALKASQDPAALGSFLRLHLGQRTKQTTRYLSLPVWDATAGMVDETKLKGKKCFGGLDLASVEDITALSWVFPDGAGGYDALWRFWLPEGRQRAMAQRTAGESDVWVKQGWLRLTPGDVVDNDEIVTKVLKDATTFNVITVGYDRWGAADVSRRLGEGGVDCVPTGQGYASLSGPLKELLRLSLSKAIRHGGNPVMRWMVDNLAVDMDPSGNVKPAKDKAADKIDGIPAVIMALREAMAEEEQAKGLTRVHGTVRSY
jgi:phage terminase large subunit-like protein